MHHHKSTRLAWALAGATAVYAIVNVIMYYANGSFGVGWFTTSLVFYGAVLVCAVGLALLVPDSDAAAPGAPHGPRGEPKLIERTVTYRTRDGMAVRLVYVWPDGAREVRHVAFTPAESLPLHDIETQLDAFPPTKAPADMDAGIDGVLRARVSNHEEVPA